MTSMVEVRIPKWGMGINEGRVLGWMKQVGDRVTAGEVLAEIETAKAVQEMQAPVSGRLSAILVEAGTLVPIRELIALIETAEDAA